MGEGSDAPRQRFLAGTYLTLSTALTVYLALIGVVRLLLPIPGSSRLVGLAFLIASAATVPLWWRRLFRTASEADRT